MLCQINYLIPLLILLAVLYAFNKKSLSSMSLTGEPFQDYKLCPYGEVYSGSDPLYFYNYDRYRKPYRWPFKYHSSYPYPHMNPLP